MTSFFSPGSAKDHEYEIVRDTPKYQKDRKFVEHIWIEYARYAEPNFLDQAKEQFKQRFWEMYLAYSLIHKGLLIQHKSSSEGPDIHLKLECLDIWIEATTPNKGKSEDAVVEREIVRLQHEEFQNIPVHDVQDKEAILRYRSAIEDKYKDYKRYFKKGILKSESCYIIAVNGRGVLSPPRETEIPRIIRSVLPFGNERITINTNTLEIVDRSYKYRDKLMKKNQVEIKTDIFCNSEYDCISAILFSCVDAVNRPEKLGDDFVLIHNPLAKNKLPLELVKLGREYWVENLTLRCTNWVKH